MKGKPNGFWAKLQKNDDGVVTSWHSLEDHSADVAAVAERLLSDTILQHRFARLLRVDELDTPRVQRLSALVAIHDAGKVNHGFQNKAGRGPRAGHVGPILNLLFGIQGKHADSVVESLGLREMSTWFDAPEQFFGMLSSTFSHHGRPVGAERKRESELRIADERRDPLEGLRKLRAAVERWYPQAFCEDAKPFVASPSFQHAFNGLVTLADWLGSDEKVFGFTPSDTGDRMRWSRDKAKTLLCEMSLNPAPARSVLGDIDPGFKAVSGETPYDVQKKCLNLPVEPTGSLTVLESDTGSGKTEAVLARFVRLFHAGVVDGMYFALPTRTAATQLHQRVVEAMNRAFTPESRPPVVLAVPGYLRVDNVDGLRARDVDPNLPPFEVSWPDDPEDSRRHRRWASEVPKRYLAGAISVGTIDQVLLSALQTNHAQMRATSLMRSLLVVDEVHASDAYMNCILHEVLDRHLEAGGHALLLSATLGTRAASRYFKEQNTPSLEEARNLSYPLIRHSGANRTQVACVPAENSGRTKTVRVSTLRIDNESSECIARRALQRARKGARVLVIRNTVADCVQTQSALQKLIVDKPELGFRVGNLLTPHHSRFSAADRRLLDERLEADLGKGSSRSGFVVVATQTVQQSLDLDADFMLTDLCPIDVLLQRIGRLHRHIRTRPAGFEDAMVEVLFPDVEDLGEFIKTDGDAYAAGPHGLGTVYADLRVLEATRRLIDERPEWSIPMQNRLLVEQATHPEILMSIADELGGHWEAHQTYIVGAEFGDRSVAKMLLIERNKPFHRASYSKETLNQQVKTRLGLDDRQVAFRSAFESALGQSVKELTIPEHMCAGLSEDDEFAENVRTDESKCTFTFGSQKYRYDHHGLAIHSENTQ